MAKTAPSPIAYRPATVEDRTRLELVARHQGLTISKLVARIVGDYTRAYVDEVGLNALINEVRDATQQREDLLTQQLDLLLRQAALASDTSDRDTSLPTNP